MIILLQHKSLWLYLRWSVRGDIKHWALLVHADLPFLFSPMQSLERFLVTAHPKDCFQGCMETVRLAPSTTLPTLLQLCLGRLWTLEAPTFPYATAQRYATLVVTFCAVTPLVWWPAKQFSCSLRQLELEEHTLNNALGCKAITQGPEGFHRFQRLHGHGCQLQKMLSLNCMDTSQLHHLALGSGTAPWHPLFNRILWAETCRIIHLEFTYTAS